MAAKYPACAERVSNNRSPVGAPRFNHTGVRQPTTRPCRGRGDTTPVPPGLLPGRRRGTPRSRSRRRPHSPALGLRSDRASWPAPPWGRHTRRHQTGVPRAAPQPAALRAKRAPNPGAARCRAGPLTDTACRRHQPGFGTPSWAPIGTPEFWHPLPAAPRIQPVPAASAAQGQRQPSRRTLRFGLPQLRQVGGVRKPLTSSLPERGALPTQRRRRAAPAPAGYEKPRRKT